MSTKGILNTKQLMAGFGVGHMTIFNWRAGTATREKLPHAVDEKKRVSFKASEVKAWAKKHELTFKAPTEPATWGTPGPAPGFKVAASEKPEKKIKPSVKAKFARVAKLVEAQVAAATENAKRKGSKRADQVSAAMVAAKPKKRLAARGSVQ